MKYGTSKDRAQEWLKKNQTLLIQVGAAIAIAVIVSAIMIPGLAVTHGKHEAAMDRTDQGFSHVGAELADLSRAHTDVSRDLEAAEDKIVTLTATVTAYDNTIETLDTRVGGAEATLGQVQEELAQVQASAPEAWLTGTAGNYTLHARSSKAGTFTTNVHLCYSKPVALSAAAYSDAMAEFYAGLNTTTPAYKHYVPLLSHNGTVWAITSISFNTGTFTLEAKTERTIAVMHSGLPEVYKPNWAYVEIYPVLKES